MKLKLQKDFKDCGLVVLQGFIRFFFKFWVPIELLKREAEYGEEGITLQNLETLAKQYHLKMKVFRGDFESLRSLKFIHPISVLIEEEGLRHMVVCRNIRTGKVYYSDPIFGKVVESNATFKKKYLGYVIVFVPQKTQKTWKFLFKKQVQKLSDLNISIPWAYKATIFFANFFLLLLSFISFFYLKLVFDSAFPLKDKLLLLKLTFLFFFIYICNFVCQSLNDLFNYFLTNKFEKVIYDRYWKNISTMDNKIRSKISNSELYRRWNLLSSFALFKTSVLTTFLGDFVTFFSMYTFLFLINKMLALISLSMLLTYFFLTLAINFCKKNKNKVYNVYQKEHFNYNWDLIGFNIQNKPQVHKRYFLNLAKDKLRNFQRIRNNVVTIDILLFNFSSFFSFVLMLVVHYVGFYKIFSNNFKMSDLFFFTSILHFCFLSLNRISVHFSNYLLHDEHYKDTFILLQKHKNPIHDNSLIKIEKIFELCFANFLLFWHTPIIFIPSLRIKENRILTGANGVGKSLFLRAINCEISFSGTMRINNQSTQNIDLNTVKTRIFFTNNSNFLPNISVEDFVMLKQVSYKETFYHCYQKYNLFHFLLANNIKLNQKIINGGVNFSLGQKQIIKLLPLFTQEFDLILLDEAFDNLSSANFEFLKQCITDFQQTAIFIEVSHCKRYLFPESMEFSLNEYKI